MTLGGNVSLSTDTTLTVASAATISGIVSGANSFTKEGAAELTLSGTNTFAGPTAVNTGTLTLSGGNALADSMASALRNNNYDYLDYACVGGAPGSLLVGGLDRLVASKASAPGNQASGGDCPQNIQHSVDGQD